MQVFHLLQGLCLCVGATYEVSRAQESPKSSFWDLLLETLTRRKTKQNKKQFVLKGRQFSLDSITQNRSSSHGARTSYELQSFSMPSGDGFQTPEVRLIFAAMCVCYLQKGSRLLASILFWWMRFRWNLCRLELYLEPAEGDYFQIASRASRVRLMSRI